MPKLSLFMKYQYMKTKSPQGQVATLFIVLIALVFIFMAITINIGKIAGTKTELDNAADSASLLAASRLGSVANIANELMGCDTSIENIFLTILGIAMLLSGNPTGALMFISSFGSQQLKVQILHENFSRLSKLDEKTNVQEQAILVALSQLVQDPNMHEGGDSADLDGDGDRTDDVSEFNYWYEARLKFLEEGEGNPVVGEAKVKLKAFVDELMSFKTKIDTLEPPPDDYGKYFNEEFITLLHDLMVLYDTDPARFAVIGQNIKISLGGFWEDGSDCGAAGATCDDVDRLVRGLGIFLVLLTNIEKVKDALWSASRTIEGIFYGEGSDEICGGDCSNWNKILDNWDDWVLGWKAHLEIVLNAQDPINPCRVMFPERSCCETECARVADAAAICACGDGININGAPRAGCVESCESTARNNCRGDCEDRATDWANTTCGDGGGAFEACQNDPALNAICKPEAIATCTPRCTETYIKAASCFEPGGKAYTNCSNYAIADINRIRCERIRSPHPPSCGAGIKYGQYNLCVGDCVIGGLGLSYDQCRVYCESNVSFYCVRGDCFDCLVNACSLNNTCKGYCVDKCLDMVKNIYPGLGQTYWLSCPAPVAGEPVFTVTKLDSVCYGSFDPRPAGRGCLGPEWLSCYKRELPGSRCEELNSCDWNAEYNKEYNDCMTNDYPSCLPREFSSCYGGRDIVGSCYNLKYWPAYNTCFNSCYRPIRERMKKAIAMLENFYNDINNILRDMGNAKAAEEVAFDALDAEPQEAIYAWQDTKGWHLVMVRVSDIAVPQMFHYTRNLGFTNCAGGICCKGNVAVWAWRYDQGNEAAFAGRAKRPWWKFRFGRVTADIEEPPFMGGAGSWSTLSFGDWAAARNLLIDYGLSSYSRATFGSAKTNIRVVNTSWKDGLLKPAPCTDICRP